MIKIDKNLNIVLRLNDEDGNPVIAHHTPLPVSIFETQWKLFRETYDDVSSSRSPSPVLIITIFKDVAANLGRQKEADDILAQIRGATYVSTSSLELLDIANISDDLKEEIVSKILFFIVFRRHVFPSQMKGWLSLIQQALSMELTSSSVTECLSSSTTATEAKPTQAPVMAAMGQSFPT